MCVLCVYTLRVVSYIFNVYFVFVWVMSNVRYVNDDDDKICSLCNIRLNKWFLVDMTVENEGFSSVMFSPTNYTCICTVLALIQQV